MCEFENHSAVKNHLAINYYTVEFSRGKPCPTTYEDSPKNVVGSTMVKSLVLAENQAS